MRYTDIFLRLGLRTHTGPIYAALLKSAQPLLIATIAHATQLPRPEVYRCVAQLLQKGFIRKEPIGRRTAYRAEDPRVVSTAFDAVARDVHHQTTRAAKALTNTLPTNLRYFKGRAGIRAVFDDVVTHTPRGGTFYRYTSERDLASVNSYLSPTYRQLRDRKKLERLVISNPRSGAQKKPRLERFIRYMPTEVSLFDHNIIELIYGDRLAFIQLSTEDAFIIEDKQLADFQKVIFKQLFKKL